MRVAIYILLLLTIVSCNSNNGSSESEQNDSDEFVEYENIEDSIDGKAVSHDCAIVYTKLDNLIWKWQEIKSPSMLATRRASFKSDLAKLKKEVMKIEGEEGHTLDSIYEELVTIEAEKVKEYSVPASGVIAQLKHCIKSVDNVQTVAEFERFRDCRLGVLESLDIIHYSVEPSSPQIKEVQKLARTLKGKYEEKCHKFGLDK